MSHDTNGPDRHRPILHLRQATDLTSVSQTNSAGLSPADHASEQSPGRDRPEAARRKRQGGRRSE